MRKKILVAEDNRSFRMMLGLVLSEHYEVRSVDNGLSLEQELAEGSYDLLISDLNLPRKNATSVLRSYARQTVNALVPTIIVTGLEDDCEEVLSVRRLVNVREVFQKPIDFRKLKARVDEILNSEVDPICSQIYRAVATMQRVLIVDDEEDMRQFMYELLDEAGLEARTCNGISEALRLCAENVFDAIVLDYVLADGLADEVIKRLPQVTQGTKLPVVMVVTGFGDMVRAEQFGEHTFVKDVLPKPFSADDLVSRVKGILKTTPSPLAAAC